jgi:hypothetical protein
VRNLWRHVGAILAATGVLHLVVFAALGRGPAADIARAGVVNSIGGLHDRGLFWYGGMMAGVALVLVGLLLTSWVRATGRPVPRYVGWTLVVLGVCTAVLDPLSGGVLVVAVGLIALSGPREESGAKSR